MDNNPLSGVSIYTYGNNDFSGDMVSLALNKILRLLPEYRDYLWGGNRLRPDIVPTAEAWVIYEADRIANGPLTGRTLAEVANEFGGDLLGAVPFQRTGTRFPLLIKLLDCAQWLSLQVHPNDEQALSLEGPNHFGKTEAWHIIDAARNAQLIAGTKPNTSFEQLADAIRNETVVDWVQYHTVHSGDSIFMPPGTLHALGPGLLLYEVQQTSDLTYRVYDWGRPQTPTRKLHIEKSLAVVNHKAEITPIPLTIGEFAERKTLITCPYFKLEYIHGIDQSIFMNTERQSFHAITITKGAASIQAGAESEHLKPNDSVLIPANCENYEIKLFGACSLLKSSVEAV